MSNEINICLIGYGQFATKRAEALSKIDGIHIKGLYETSPQTVEKCKERYFDIRIHKTFEDASLNSNYDLYIISTPNDLHFEQCSYLLEKNANILCEKPITTTPSQAQELELAFRNSSSHLLYMGSNLSFFPSYKLLTKYINKANIKKIDSAYIEIGHKISLSNTDWRTSAKRSGGGTLIDNGLHALYYLNSIFSNMFFKELINIEKSQEVETEINIHLSAKESQDIQLFSTWNKNINYSRIEFKIGNSRISAKAFDNFIEIINEDSIQQIECEDTSPSLESESNFIIDELKRKAKFTNIRSSKEVLDIIYNCYESYTEI